MAWLEQHLDKEGAELFEVCRNEIVSKITTPEAKNAFEAIEKISGNRWFYNEDDDGTVSTTPSLSLRLKKGVRFTAARGSGENVDVALVDTFQQISALLKDNQTLVAILKDKDRDYTRNDPRVADFII